MKITTILHSIQAAYTEAMARAKRAQHVPIPPTTVQAVSTQAILDGVYHHPSPEELKALAPVKDQYGNVDVGERPLSVKEIQLEETKRRRPKNSLGQVELRGVHTYREEAITAFMKHGIQLSQEDIERLTLLGQLGTVSGILASANTEEDFIRLMNEAGLASERDLLLVRSGYGQPK